MARVLFDLLFVLSLVLPVLALFAGAMALLLPRRFGLTVRRRARAHA